MITKHIFITIIILISSSSAFAITAKEAKLRMKSNETVKSDRYSELDPLLNTKMAKYYRLNKSTASDGSWSVKKSVNSADCNSGCFNQFMKILTKDGFHFVWLVDKDTSFKSLIISWDHRL